MTARIAQAEADYAAALQAADHYRLERGPIFEQMDALTTRVEVAKQELLDALLAAEQRTYSGAHLKVSVRAPQSVSYDPHQLPEEVSLLPGVLTQTVTVTVNKAVLEALVSSGYLTDDAIAPARTVKLIKPSLTTTWLVPHE